MNKVFSKLEIKSTGTKNGKRTFTGIASTPTPDRADDIVEPKGAVFNLPLPLLWQHDHKDPIGWITKANVKDSGIEIEGEVADIPESGNLKERLTEAWQMLKNKLVQGLSIGFRTLEHSEIDGSWGWRILKWDWLELSAVTIPCNEECTINTIKAAFGHKSNPGVKGKNERRSEMKTLHEQLQELKDSRALKLARMTEISEKITNKTASAEDGAEFDTISEEISALDDQIRVKTTECLNASTAKTVKPSVSTAPNVHTKTKDKDEQFEGQNFTRKIIAKAVAQRDNISPIAVAKKRWGSDNPRLIEIIKADVEGGSSASGAWGAELVSEDNRYTGDFIEFLKSKTVYDQLGLRAVPAHVNIKGQDGIGTGYWVGESASIPVSAQSFTDVSLTPLKVAALAVVSNELLRDSSPAAEQLVRDALVEASSQKVDTTFFSDVAASAGISPAGILNGVIPTSATGTDADALRADIKTLVAAFITAKNASGLELVMNPALALSIQMLYNALGQPEFKEITQNGGSLLGMPVKTGDNITTTDLIMLKASDIYKIGDTGVEVSMSREATIEMADNPAMNSQVPTGPTGKTVGMFQTESTAIKVVRSINYQRRRAAASVVGYIDDAAYDNSSS